jgi:hypothetical protein
MTQRAESIPIRSRYDEMPFFLVLFRYLWPFWLFKDASRGDRYARAAAYRHNRSMRTYLPGYMLKWMFNSALGFALVALADSFSRHMAASWGVFTLIAAAAIVFACSLCVLLVTGYVYWYLDRNDLNA